MPRKRSPRSRVYSVIWIAILFLLPTAVVTATIGLIANLPCMPGNGVQIRLKTSESAVALALLMFPTIVISSLLGCWYWVRGINTKTWTLEDVAAHWDSQPEYDQINDKIDSYFRRFEDSSPLFSIPENARVLDCDCRTARGTAYFKQKYPTASFTCVAMAPTFVERSKNTLQKENLRADVHLMQVLPLPFDDASFDVILTYETLEHVPWPRRYIEELSRLLAPGGTLVLTTPNVLWEPVHWLSATLKIDHGEGPHRMVPRGDILNAFRKAGLSVETERTFVLVPTGPKWLLGFGRWLERTLPQWLLRMVALRRTFICTKHG